MNTYDYQSIEKLLLELLALLLEIFSESEEIEIREFIDVSEYGLALETLVEIVVEENKQISEECLKLVCMAADEMQLDKNVFEEKLRGHVADV